jgi:hypothetical protein
MGANVVCGAIGNEEGRLPFGITATDLQRPKAVLAAVEIELVLSAAIIGFR